MSVFRRILNARMAMDHPPPPEAIAANWLYSLLVLADANAIGNDVESSVPAEAHRRLIAASVPPLIAEHVRRYAENLKV